MSTEESGAARAALVAGVLVVALVLGVALLALTPDADRLPPGGRLVPVFTVVVGWSFAGLGGFAAWRRPDNPTGALLTAFGLAALLSGMAIADAPLPYLVSGLADALALPLFVHLLLSFPSGRVEDRASRWVVAASYVSAAVPQVVATLVGEPAGEPSCADCPDNPILVASHDGVAEAALAVKSAAGLALALAAVVLVARRARASSPFQRRAFTPLAIAGALLLVLVVVSVTAQAVDASDAVQKAAQLVFIAGFAGLPVAFLIGLQRSRFFRSATVTAVIDRLAAGRGAHDLEGDLAAALGDPSLTVAYWLPEGEEYVDRQGHPMTVAAQDAGSVVTEITHQGRRVGAIVHDGTLREDSELMRAVAGAAGLALENERLEVELRARLQALRASRTRIVAVGDAERRRLGRDLHDGAQQRLISVLLDLQLARERWEEDRGSSRELVDRALDSARAAVEELRDLASGIHPAILAQRGLDAALESLATRSPVPVELVLVLDERLPSATETAAYFVVAEALTNVAKYAQATYASVMVRRENGDAVVEVRDDGVGGADTAGGTGLLGLGDRVGALDGTIELDSPPDEGTVVRARIPLAP